MGQRVRRTDERGRSIETGREFGPEGWGLMNVSKASLRRHSRRTLRLMPFGLFPLTRPSADVDATLDPLLPRLAIRPRASDTHQYVCCQSLRTAYGECFSWLVHRRPVSGVRTLHPRSERAPRLRSLQQHRRSLQLRPRLLHLIAEIRLAGVMVEQGDERSKSKPQDEHPAQRAVAGEAGWQSCRSCLPGTRDDDRLSAS